MLIKLGRKRDPTTVLPIHRLIDQRLVGVVFQPIVDLETWIVFSYEALARPRLEPFRGPEDMIEAAVHVGRVGELGRIIRELAVGSCADHPLFINIDPNEFDCEWLVRPDDPMYFHKHSLYLEITESVPLAYFEQCQGVLAETRGKGVLLAVDDLGSGYSNLKYISDLEPEIVKLDRELIAGLRTGTRAFRLVQSIVGLCGEMGAKVVAEGIENFEEYRAVRAAGAQFGQGYLFSKPAFPPPDPTWLATTISPDEGDPRGDRRSTP